MGGFLEEFFLETSLSFYKMISNISFKCTQTLVYICFYLDFFLNKKCLCFIQSIGYIEDTCCR